MAYAYVDLVATAGQQNFAFDIPYLSRNNISVFQNGVVLDVADWTFLMAQIVRLDVGADEADIIRVRRVTPIDEPIVDYANGSVLGENELDATALQSLFAAQEVADSLEGAITQNDFLQWDAQGLPIVNLGDARPDEEDDAMNQGDFGSIQQATEDARDLAIAAKVLAQTAQAAAELAEAHAETAETNAELAETNAETAETNAELAETNAELAETNAEAAQAAAAASAATATTQASNAATQASNAATSASNASTSSSQASSSASAASSSASAASGSASAASVSAAAALASEVAAALSAAKLSGTSTTSLLIAVASKVFTTQSGKFFSAGTWVLVTSDADPTNYMHGQVTSYVTTTLTVNVTNIGGAGTFADWTIRVSGTRGAVGATGADGTPGANLILVSRDGAGVGTRPEINFINGTGSDLTVADNAGANQVDVTINVTSDALDAHEIAADPHTGYQKESEKGAADGYAGLDAFGELLPDLVNVDSIQDQAVTYVKIQGVATDKLLGRGNGGGSGDTQEITLGTNLSMSGTTLNAAGGGGGDSLIYEFW